MGLWYQKTVKTQHKSDLKAAKSILVEEFCYLESYIMNNNCCNKDCQTMSKQRF